MAAAMSCPSTWTMQPGGDKLGHVAVSTPVEEAIIQSPTTSCAEGETVGGFEDHNRLKIIPRHRDYLTTQPAENIPCSVNLACSYKAI